MVEICEMCHFFNPSGIDVQHCTNFSQPLNDARNELKQDLIPITQNPKRRPKI
jgi:hypothetical protein